jgi:hypothetical protein
MIKTLHIYNHKHFCWNNIQKLKKLKIVSHTGFKSILSLKVSYTRKYLTSLFVCYTEI